MPYLAVDDRMWGHRKVIKLGSDKVAAMGLWVLAGSWAAGHMTDGFVPDYVVEQWDPDQSLAKRLVAVGLWHETSWKDVRSADRSNDDAVDNSADAVDESDVGYVFHDWSERNGTRESIEQARAEAAERKRRSRERRRLADGTLGPDDKGPGGGQSSQESHVTNGHVTRDSRVTDGPVTGESLHTHPTPPHPTKSVPSEHSLDAPRREPAPATKIVDPPGFEAFWQACPKKTGKGAARKSYAKALRIDGVTAATLLAAMTGAARFWKITRTETRFVPNPATWLNQERWADEVPMPGTAVAVGFGSTPAPSGRVPTTTQRVADIQALKD